MSDDLSGKLAAAFRDAMVAAHHDTADSHHTKTAQARTDTMELWERELSDTIKSLEVIDFNDPALPEPIRKLFAPINKPTNQTDFFVSIFAVLGLFFTGAAAASAGLVQVIQNSSLKKSGDLYPDSATSAAMWVRDIIQETTARGWMDMNGTRRERADALKELAWNHLPAATVMDLMRRRKMTVDEGRRIMRVQGMPAIEIEQLITSLVGPPDIGLLVAAVTQSQIDRSEFQRLLPEFGIDPAYADVIFKTAGASPSVQETLELWNRGLIDEATVDKIVLESPIKNEYVPVLKLMRHRFPALEQTTTLMRRGIMTLEEGKDAIRKLGYEPSLADKMAEYASQAQSGTAKNLTVGQMVDLYELGRWDAGKLTARLTGAGFDPDEAADILDLANERKQHAIVERAATSIGTRYVSWKIDRSTAIQLLDQVNYPGTQRDELLAVWDARREAQTLHLTEAFLHKAFNAGVINADEVRPRLLAMGYDEVDTDIIMRTDFAVTAAKKKSKDLSRADEVKRYEKGLITPAQLRERLLSLGYDETEAGQIMELSDIKLADAAAKESATNGA